MSVCTSLPPPPPYASAPPPAYPLTFSERCAAWERAIANTPQQQQPQPHQLLVECASFLYNDFDIYAAYRDDVWSPIGGHLRSLKPGTSAFNTVMYRHALDRFGVVCLMRTGIPQGKIKVKMIDQYEVDLRDVGRLFADAREDARRFLLHTNRMIYKSAPDNKDYFLTLRELLTREVEWFELVLRLGSTWRQEVEDRAAAAEARAAAAEARAAADASAKAAKAAASFSGRVRRFFRRG